MSKKYWEAWKDWVPSLEEDWEENTHQRSTWYGTIEKVVEELSCKNVLDAGCGIGMDYVFLSGLGLNYHGIDVTPEMIQRARERHPTGLFDQGDLYDSKWLSLAFDLVTNHDVLMHVPNYQMALKGLWKLTKKALMVRVSYVWNKPTELVQDTYGFYNHKFNICDFINELMDVTGQQVDVVSVEDNERSADCFDNRQIFIVRRGVEKDERRDASPDGFVEE